MVRARQVGVVVPCAVFDCAYGDVDIFRGALRTTGIAWVAAVRPLLGVWAYTEEGHTPRCRTRAGLERAG
ncbi:MAG: Transposase [Actinoallomurus sp.]|nr:Transposase [Actinoallomurus sp.]